MQGGNNWLLAFAFGLCVGLFVYYYFFSVDCDYIQDDFQERIEQIIKDENFKKDVSADSIYQQIRDRLNSGK